MIVDDGELVCAQTQLPLYEWWWFVGGSVLSDESGGGGEDRGWDGRYVLLRGGCYHGMNGICRVLKVTSVTC